MRCLLCIVIVFVAWSNSLATGIHVGGSQKIKTIQHAVEIANSGDTIFIHSGIYTEGNIVVKKSLTFIGLNYPVIDGNMKVEQFTIAAENVTIDGLNVINSGRSSMNDLAGIKCLDAHHVIIRNNIFENTFFAIHLSNTNFSTIENNKLIAKAEHEYQLGNGIHLWKCHHAKITNNDITGHRDGIYFEFVTKSYIYKNISRYNIRYGLHFMFSHDNDYVENIFTNNGAGVAVMYTRNVKMIRNVFQQNWGSASYGLLLKDISGSEVLQNKFIGNTSGIYMEGTTRTRFEANVFDGNGWAVKLQASCDGNTFYRNNFINNTFDISTNGTLVLNKIDGNYWDKYTGYDLNRDGMGDIPYYPVNLFSMITEIVPAAILLWRSFLVFLLDQAEKVMPAITPQNLRDNQPVMKPYDLN